MNAQIPTLVTTLFIGSAVFAAPSPDDLLSGPSIVEEEVTEEDMRSRKLNETGKSRKSNSRQHSKLWTQAALSIDLTASQKVEIQKIRDELQTLQQEFHKKYCKEIQALRGEQRVAKQNDETPSSESQQRMMEIHSSTPDVTVFQEQVWVLLTTEQQTAFKVSYQKLIEEDQKRKEERKNKDQSMEDKQNRDFGSRDSILKNKDTKRVSDGDSVDRRKDSVNDRSLRRIKFLRRLQQLENDK